MKYKIGIIGLGGAGIVLLKEFHRREDCEVVGVLDTENVKDRYPLNDKLTFTTDETFFFSLGQQINVVTSPDSTHAYYVSKSLNNKIHVLCEKPLTDSLKGIEQIEKAIKDNPEIKIMVQHQMRNVPMFKDIKSLLNKNKLGKIGYIEGYYVHNLKNRAFVNHNWRNDDIATPMVYSGIHFIDLLMWMLNEKPVEVYAMSNNILFPEYAESDCNVLLMKFKSGVIAKVITAFGVNRPQDHSIQIYGEEASITNNIYFSNNTFKVFTGPIRNSLPERRFNYLKDSIILMYFHFFKFLMHFFPKNGQYSISNFPFRLYEHRYAVRQSVNDFIVSIKNNSNPAIPIHETVAAVKVALAGVQSYRTGKPIRLDW